MVKAVVQGLAFLTLLSDIFILQLAVSFILEKLRLFKFFGRQKKFFGPRAWSLIFTVSAVATLGSLFFSEVGKFVPCLLCWYQRIFMYPQPIMIYLAIMRDEYVIRPYLYTLNVIGGLIALYHVFIQRFPALSIAPCDATGVSCTKVHNYYWGYITIPMMALTAFVLNMILLSLWKSKVQSSNVKSNPKSK